MPDSFEFFRLFIHPCINSKARQWILKNFTAETGNAVTLFLYLANLGPIRTTGGLSQRESWAQTMLFWGQASSPIWSGNKVHLNQDLNWLMGWFGIWFGDQPSDDGTKPEKNCYQIGHSVVISIDIYCVWISSGAIVISALYFVF